MSREKTRASWRRITVDELRPVAVSRTWREATGSTWVGAARAA